MYRVKRVVNLSIEKMKESKKLLHMGRTIKYISEVMGFGSFDMLRKNMYADCRVCRYREQSSTSHACVCEYEVTKQYGWEYCNKFENVMKNGTPYYGTKDERWSRA